MKRWVEYDQQTLISSRSDKIAIVSVPCSLVLCILLLVIYTRNTKLRTVVRLNLIECLLLIWPSCMVHD